MFRTNCIYQQYIVCYRAGLRQGPGIGSRVNEMKYNFKQMKFFNIFLFKINLVFYKIEKMPQAMLHLCMK